MVNSELFRKIADRIEKNPESYDQSSWSGKYGCGCILWHAEQIYGIDSETSDLDESIKLFGLDRVDAGRLYHALWKPKHGLSVPEALRLISNGATVAEVSA